MPSHCRHPRHIVTPAKAGVHASTTAMPERWAPAFAGATSWERWERWQGRRRLRPAPAPSPALVGRARGRGLGRGQGHLGGEMRIALGLVRDRHGVDEMLLEAGLDCGLDLLDLLDDAGDLVARLAVEQ